jgi:hypothetical protein
VEALENVVNNVQYFVELFPQIKGDYNVSALVENMLDTKIKPSIEQVEKVITKNNKAKGKV